MKDNDLEAQSRKFRAMTIEQMLKQLGLTRGKDTDKNTYLYIDTDGRLTACQKTDRNSIPRDQHEQIGYVIAFEKAGK
jgi:hypothetical protein